MVLLPLRGVPRSPATLQRSSVPGRRVGLAVEGHVVEVLAQTDLVVGVLIDPLDGVRVAIVQSPATVGRKAAPVVDEPDVELRLTVLREVGVLPSRTEGQGP